MNILIVLFSFLVCVLCGNDRVPAIYLIEPFPEWSSFGPASPFVFNTSPGLRYNPSTAAFISNDDFTFAYLPTDISADTTTTGFSFTRKINNQFRLGGYFSMLSSVNVITIGDEPLGDGLGGFQNYLIVPSLSYKINSRFSAGTEFEMNFLNCAQSVTMEPNIGFAGSFTHPVFSSGIFIKNVISPFSGFDAPFMIINGNSLHLLKNHLIIGGGVFYRLSDGHAGPAAGIKISFLRFFDMYGAYNDGSVSGGLGVKYSSFRFNYGFRRELGFSQISDITSSVNHSLEITVFYEMKDFRDPFFFQKKIDSLNMYMTEGKEHYQQTNYALAAESLKKALRIEPGYPMAMQLLKTINNEVDAIKSSNRIEGTAHFNNGMYVMAATNFKRIIECDPSDKDAIQYLDKIKNLSDEVFGKLYLFAEIEMRKKNYEDALSYCDQILFLNADHDRAAGLRATLLRKTEEEKDALQKERIGKEILEKANSLLDARDFEQGITLLKEARQYFRDKEKIDTLIAQSEQYRKDSELYNRANIYYKQALTAYAQTNYHLALTNLEAAVKIYPQYSDALIKQSEFSAELKALVKNHTQKGVAAFENENYAEAEANWRFVLQIDPRNQLVSGYITLLAEERVSRKDNFYRMGAAAFQRKKYGDAVINLQKAADLDPSDEKTKNLLEQAKIELTKATRLYKSRGMALFSEKKYDPAKRQFELLLEIDPENETAKKYLRDIDRIVNSAAIYGRAVVFFENREFERAKEEFIKIITPEGGYKDSGQYLVRIDNELAKKEKEGKLLKMFEEGAVSFQRQRFAEAIKIWEEVKAADPQNNLVSEYIKIAEIKLKEITDVNYNKALAAIKKGDWLTARSELDIAHEANPQNQNLINKRTEVEFKIKAHMEELMRGGSLSFANGSYAKAAENFELILKYEPSHEAAEEKKLQTVLAGDYLAKAVEAEKKKNIPEAIVMYREILSINPSDRQAVSKADRLTRDLRKNIDAAVEEGNRYLQEKKYYQALQMWESVLPVASEMQAVTLKKQIEETKTLTERLKKNALEAAGRERRSNNLAQALRHYNAYLELAPNDAAVIRQRNETSAAINAQSKKAGEEKQELIRIGFARGIELYQAGKFKEAISQWEKVLGMDPGNEKARSYIARARARLELLGQ